MQVRNIMSGSSNTHDRVERAKQLIEEKGSDVAHQSRKSFRRAQRYTKAHPWTVAAAGTALAVGALSALFLLKRGK